MLAGQIPFQQKAFGGIFHHVQSSTRIYEMRDIHATACSLIYG